ncbi:unnamed protein product [Nezara viridula]|uniref:Uncharacterized protein n=1 Tax=Nezara viridula TaxID=85310 RepID=A0A9P0MT39_NEZVI|nr:unnamed protein product [Nezara viridula]
MNAYENCHGAGWYELCIKPERFFISERINSCVIKEMTIERYRKLTEMETCLGISNIPGVIISEVYYGV